MKKLFTLFTTLLMISACTSDKNTYKQISSSKAQEIIESQSDYIILDVRTIEEYKDTHIKGAVNIPNEIIDESVYELLPNKDQMILVYCRSGNRSKQASEKLVNLGYTNIIEFGGINSWKGETKKY